MSQPNQQDIESWLWDSANILRGPVDPANLRDFVFPLLFLKRLHHLEYNVEFLLSS
jgi:type I restriction enzyme M protein